MRTTCQNTEPIKLRNNKNTCTYTFILYIVMHMQTYINIHMYTIIQQYSTLFC